MLPSMMTVIVRITTEMMLETAAKRQVSFDVFTCEERTYPISDATER